MWTFERGEGAPAKGVFFRSSTGNGFGPWKTAADFFDCYPAEDALQDAIDAEYASDAEMAWSLAQNHLGSRTQEEGQPDYLCIEVALDGAAVLTASATIKWGKPEPEGDSRPYAAPICSEVSVRALKRALKRALREVG